MADEKRRVLFVGAGRAQLYALARIGDYLELGTEVTVVSPEPDLLCAGMSPKLVSGQAEPAEIAIPARRIVESHGGRFVSDKVTSIDPDSHVVHTRTGEEIPYDIASFATGSQVAPRGIEGAREHSIPVSPLTNLARLHEEVSERLRAGEKTRVYVIGGGVSGVEVTCHLLALARGFEAPNLLRLAIAEAKSHILHTFPRRFGRFLYQYLIDSGVRISNSAQVAEIAADSVRATKGKAQETDLTVLATGPGFGGMYRRAGFAADVTGALVVNSSLESVSHPGVFAAGDCARLRGHKLVKLGVYAAREGPVLHRNLLARLRRSALESYHPQRTVTVIVNLGDGRGALAKGRFVLRGRLALALKELIDRRFVALYRSAAGTA